MVDDNANVADNPIVGKTSVFLAWSGSVSQKMAGLLKEYLPLFVRNINIFMSEDITKGKRWQTEIVNALDSTKFGILCLTPENLTSEWIHFEAGALSKTIDESTHVCPLLLDVKKSELKEPLASFHATLFDKKEFKKLVNDLAHACGDSLEEGQLTTLMEALWPKIDDSINLLKAEFTRTRQESGEPEDTDPKIDPLLEEIVVRVREQGRFMAMLSEQGGAGLGKEIIEAVQEIRMSQRRTLDFLKKHDNRMFYSEREGDYTERRSMNMSSRTRKLSDILRQLPNKFVATSDPEIVLDALIRTGPFGERLIDEFGGRAEAIDAINFMIKRNKHRLAEDDELFSGDDP